MKNIDSKILSFLILYLTLFCLVFLPVFVSADDSITLKVGLYENEPKIFTEKGKATGFWPDIIDYIASKENWKIEWVHGTWNECLERLESGKIDIMPDIAYTEIRSERYAFQNETVFISWARVYVPKDSKIQSFPDLNNKKIAVLKGSVNYTGEEGIKELTEKFKINCTFVETSDYNNVFELVEKKKVDAGVVNKNFGNEKEKKYKVKRTGIVFQPAALKFAFPKKSTLTPRLMSRIDYHIKELKEDKNSVYYKSMKKYFEGSIAERTVLPNWVKNVMLIIGGTLLFFMMVCALSRFQIKRKTSQLKESEERYRTLFNSSKDAIMTLEPSTLKFTSGNSSILDMFKIKNEKELMSLTPCDVSPEKQPDGRFSEEKAKEMILTAMEEGSNFFEWIHQRCNGEEFPATVLLTRVDFSDKSSILQATVRDITKFKQTEEALREGEEKFRTVIENLPQGVFVHDLDGHIIMINKASCENTGYTRDELLDMKMTDVDPECLSEKEGKKLWSELQKGGFKRIGSFYRRKDDSSYPVEIHVNAITLKGKPMILSIVQDITERIEREEEYKRLINGMNDTVFVIDFNRKFVEVNDTAVKSLGYSREELLSMGPQGIDSSISDKGISLLIEGMKTDEIQVFETEHKTKSGNKIPVEISSSRVTYKGEPAILSIARDITERKKAEEEKEKMNSQLLQAQKMESVGRLAGGIAHDFNNLLTAIIGYGHLLYDEMKQEDPNKEMMEEILRAANQAANLTGQLLAFSRRNPVKLEVIDLNSLVIGIEKMIERLTGENINFSCMIHEDQLNIKADPTQLEQIILNLIVNARDAMPKGGKIIAKTEKVNISDGDTNDIPYSYAGDFACLSVTDTGLGMDKKTVSKIFDPFFTTKKTGTGLGLSVVHEIIKKLEGWVNVESTPEKGTTFKVYLPVSYEKKTSDEKETISMAELHGNGELILVIEDERITRKFIIKALKENGYSVLETEKIEEAREIFNNKEDDIKMVFSDIVLSDGSGLEFAKEIKSKNKEIKILLSSGYIDEKAELSYIAEKKFSFLGKPYDVLKLLKAIKKVLS